MALDSTRANAENSSSSWFTAEVQMLQSQMALLQSALESSKQAVESFHKRASANLVATEQHYHDLFDNVLTGVYRMASDGGLLLANRTLVRMLGYERLEELAERKLTPPSRLAAAMKSHLIGFERTWRKKNGERIDVRESCRVVRDDDGAILYYEGVVEDITGQKKAAAFEHDCRALLELVVRNEPLERIVHQLVRIAERQVPGAYCSVMLARDGKLYPAAVSGLPSEFLRAIRSGIPISSGSATCGAAALRGQVAITEEICQDPAWAEYRAAAEAHGIRSCWSMPIHSGRGSVLGTLAVYRQDASAPSFAEMQLLETTSRLASVAIEHRQLCDQLEQQAKRDRLTNLPNRSMFEERLGAAIGDAARSGSKVALLWIDLDRFKEINDTLGHRVGDDLIGHVASRLQPAVHPPALLARTGGDEFAVVIPNVADLGEVEACAVEIMAALQAPFQLRGCEIFVSASAGISVYPDHGLTATELQQNADAAMYRVKSGGRNGFAFYEPALGDTIRERMELANSLRRAVERRELELHFQPQIDLKGNLRGLEALVRWRHPSRGILYPGHFIDIAEETGLIVPIGAWVLGEACRKCVEWNQMRTEPLKVAVNVSALQFYFSDLSEVVNEALRSTGLDPSCLELELTETLVMRDAKQSATELQKLRALGVTIAIDDFGTGYSSLSYLQRLPVDLLKIDRSFLEQIDSRSASAVLEAITALAHALGLQVVAEGVEREHQLSALRRLGVDLAQGYLIGRPAPANVIDEMLRQSSECEALIA